LFSCVRVSDYIESIRDVACSVHSNPVPVYNLLFSVCCQSALSLMCLRLILTLVVKTKANLDHPLYRPTLGWFKLTMYANRFLCTDAIIIKQYRSGSGD